MEREQFTFYRSFYEALKALPKKDQLPFIMAVCAYVFEGESKPLAGAAAASFLLVKPILDKAGKKAESGKRGGSKPKANGKQNGSKHQANGQQTESHIEGEKEEEREVEVEKDISLPTPSGGEKKQGRSVPSFQQVQDAAAAMGCLDIARPFFDYYAVANWRDSEGKPVFSWQQKLAAWKARELEKERRQFAGSAAPAGRKSFAELAAEMERGA